MGSLQGKLLVASPSLADPNFAESVVLMIRHDDEGAFGLVLNRPTKVPLRHVWSKISEEPCPGDGILYNGLSPGTVTAAASVTNRSRRTSNPISLTGA